MPSRSEIAEQISKDLQIIDPTKHERPSKRSSESELLIWEAFRKTWDALISASVENEQLKAREERILQGQTCPTCKTDLRCIHGKLFEERCEPCEAPDEPEELRARQNGWISVEERLPTDNDEYLICDDDYGVSTADFRGGEWFTVRSFGPDCDERPLYCITHWQPVPEPPAAPGADAEVREGAQMKTTCEPPSYQELKELPNLRNLAKMTTEHPCFTNAIVAITEAYAQGWKAQAGERQRLREALRGLIEAVGPQSLTFGPLHLAITKAKSVLGASPELS